MARLQMPGSHLLAALHSQMERMKTAARVCKAASKTPHSRTNTDSNSIAAETQDVWLLKQEGPAVHRELCHVVQALQLKQMESFRLPGDHKSGVFGYVVTGRLQLRTKNKAGFDRMPDVNHSSSGGNTSGSNSPDTGPPSPVGASVNGSSSGTGASSTSGAQNHICSSGAHSNNPSNRGRTSKQGKISATEDELRALFDSIDVDGSGAIEVDELRHALGLMGINKQPDEVQELMDSVDKDGSGELEFEEFVLVLTTKLGVGAQQEAAWQESPDGTWSLELTEGGCFGETALLMGESQDGLILAMEDCSLLLLDATSYSNILKHGFDGQLDAKMAVIRSCPVLSSCLSARSDIRGLAYAAVNETHEWGGQLYAAGEITTALYVIQEGTCKVVATVRTHSDAQLGTSTAAAAPNSRNPDLESVSGDHVLPDGEVAAEAAAAALVTSPRYGLHSARSRLTVRRTELAMLGPGDIAGEACVLGLSQHSSSVLVSSAKLSVLRMELQDLKQLLHVADLQRLVVALQQRNEQRRDRLEAAAATTSTAHLLQQHHRAAALEAKVTAQAEEPAPIEGMFRSGLDLPDRIRPGHSTSNTPRQLGLQLPSTARGAAAAIAAAGGYSPRTGVPSAIAKQKEAAIHQLVDGLVAARQDMEAMHSMVVDAAVAALTTARAAATTACSPRLSHTAASPSELHSARGSASMHSHVQQPHRSARSEHQLHTSRSSPSSNMPSTRSSSQPESSRQPGQTGITAADLMLPLRLQPQSNALLGSSDMPADCTENECSRTYRHSRRRSPGSAVAADRSEAGNVSPKNSSPVTGTSRASGFCSTRDCRTVTGAQGAGHTRAKQHSANTAATPQTLSSVVLSRSHAAAAGAAAGSPDVSPKSGTTSQQQGCRVPSGRPAEQTPTAEQGGCLHTTGVQAYQAPVAAAAVAAAQEMIATNRINLYNSPGATPRTSRGPQTAGMQAPPGSISDPRAALCTLMTLESTACGQGSVILQTPATAAPGTNHTTPRKASNHLLGTAAAQPTSAVFLTPRGVSDGGTAGPSVARPVPFGLFTVVDDATWSASETAADTTSWLLQRQMKGLSGASKQPQQHESLPQLSQDQKQRPCHQPQVLQAGLVDTAAPASAAGLASAVDSMVQPSGHTLHHGLEQTDDGSAGLQNHQPDTRRRQMHEWLAVERGIPKLPLHEMQQSSAGGTPSQASGSDLSASAKGTNVTDRVQQNTGSRRVTSALEPPTHQPKPHDYAGSQNLMRAAVGNIKQPTGLTSRDGITSKQQQQSMAALPAPLPSFRSSLTTKWQPGGRFVPGHGGVPTGAALHRSRTAGA